MTTQEELKIPYYEELKIPYYDPGVPFEFEDEQDRPSGLQALGPRH